MNNQFMISGFADEAAVCLKEQMEVLEKNQIYYIEMRNVNGKHVLSCTAAELKELKNQLDQRGFRISAIGSPIGKSDIHADFELEKQLFLKAVTAAKILDCKYIRIFSFYIPESENPDIYRDEVLYRLRQLVAIAERENIIAALENESGIFGNNLERCEFLLNQIPSEHFKMAFDSGNFIKNNTLPYPDAYERLKEKIAYFHIKDARKDIEHFLPTGNGDARIAEMLEKVKADGFQGFLSLEPHLGYLSGLNMAQQFTTAANALKQALNLQSEQVDLQSLQDFN